MAKIPHPQVLKPNAPENPVQNARSALLPRRTGLTNVGLLFRLAVGPVLLLIGVWSFASIAEDIVTQEPIVEFDRVVVNAIHVNTTPQAIDVMNVISTVGREVPTVVTIGLAGFFIV